VRPGEQTTWERWHGIPAAQDDFWHSFDAWGPTQQAWEPTQASAWEPTQAMAWEPTQQTWEPTQAQASAWAPTQRDDDVAWEPTQEDPDVGAPTHHQGK
jgi:hypothetical protein